MPRKRAWQEMAEPEPETKSSSARVPEMLQKIRNMWEFASIMQYIFVFGKVVKIDDDLDVEDLEMECLNPTSTKLADLGLTLLKFVSSHRGLTPELFDEYTRRQYLAKAPTKNVFGDEEEPLRFRDFDVFAKLRVLHQLSIWTFWNPDRIRERMPEKEADQTGWRIEPYGWDSEDRTYYLLDDDRLYRWTDPPPPPPPAPRKSNASSKTRSKKGKNGTPLRASKRRRVSVTVPDSSDAEDELEEEEVKVEEVAKDDDMDTLGGAVWECIAVNLEDFEDLLENLKRSRDGNEKHLRKRITDELLPIIIKRSEDQQKKIVRRQKELENLERLATAKRSGRIAGKMERQRELEQAAEAERKRKDDLAMALKEQERQRKLEEARESRMMTREQRLKDREVKRILHEEELARLERTQHEESQEGRYSERHLAAERERRQRELEKLDEEEGEWDFDCAVCGLHGRNLDDGTHSIACDKCGVWQHSACHGINAEQAEQDDFRFTCASCSRPPPTKIRLNLTMSPSSQKTTQPFVKEEETIRVNGTQASSQSKVIIQQHDAIGGMSTLPNLQPPAPQRQPAFSVSMPHVAPGQQQPAPYKNGSLYQGPPQARPLYQPPSNPQPVTKELLKQEQAQAPPSSASPQHQPALHPQTYPEQRTSETSKSYHAIPSSATTSFSTPYSSSPPPSYPPPPMQTQVQTPYRNYAPLHQHSPSPGLSVPALTATLGNTDARFSPNGTSHRSPYAPSAASPAAFSPSKKPVSPVIPHSSILNASASPHSSSTKNINVNAAGGMSSNINMNPIRASPLSSFPAPELPPALSPSAQSASREGGKSPVKHDQQPPSSPPSMTPRSFGQAVNRTQYLNAVPSAKPAAQPVNTAKALFHSESVAGAGQPVPSLASALPTGGSAFGGDGSPVQRISAASNATPTAATTESAAPAAPAESAATAKAEKVENMFGLSNGDGRADAQNNSGRPLL